MVKVILVMAVWAVAGCAAESRPALAQSALECPACVNEALAFSYTRPEAALIVGTAFSSAPSNLSPTTSYAFSVSAPLPAGLTLNGVTGAITGTATAPTAGRMYRIDALSTASWRVASVWIEVVTSPQTSPQQYFVSPSGNDANPGTFSQPWKTIARGLQGRVAGDTLNLRAGVYVGDQAFPSLQGTPAAPITIRGYPGETVALEATLPDFRELTTPAQWQPATDVGHHPDEWVSTATFDIAASDVLNRTVFLERNPYTRLLTYERLEDLRATNETFDQLPANDPRPGPRAYYQAPQARPYFPWTYFGPGVYWDAAARRVHVRLSATHNGVAGMSEYTGAVDPRQVRIGIHAKGGDGAFIIRACTNVSFRYLSFRYGGQTTVRLDGNADVTFEHVEVHASTDGMMLGSDNVRTRILHTRFLAGLPPWTFRSDLKDGYEIAAADGTRLPGQPTNELVKKTTSIILNVNGVNTDTEVAYSEFLGGHDGVYLGGQNTDFHHNLIDTNDDDAMFVNASSFSTTARIHENVIRRALAALSFAAADTGSEGGLRYIYRNLIDLRAPTAGVRPRGGTDPSRFLDPWRYGTLLKPDVHVSPHAFYQNTVLVSHRLDPAEITGLAGLSKTLDADHQRRYYNNIFTAFVFPDSDNSLGIVPAVAQASIQLPDGSLAYQSRANYWNRRGTSAFDLIRCLAFVTGDTCPLPSYATLAALQTQATYAALGWEQGSREGDPGYRLIGADGAMRDADRLRLTATSPARGAGMVLPPSLPADPYAPGAAAPDIGAFQYSTTTREVLGVGVNGQRAF